MFGFPHLPGVHQPANPMHAPVTYTMRCPDCGRDLQVTSRAVIPAPMCLPVPQLCMPCACSPCPCVDCAELAEVVAA